MSSHDSDAVTVKVLVHEQAHWAERSRAGFPFGNLEDERILEADEISAELEPETSLTHASIRTSRPPAPPRRPALTAHSFAATRRTQPAHLSQPAAASARGLQPSAALDLPPELQAMRLELARLQSQMRARDAYLVELEQALDASTRQLAASGIASIDDAQRLLGRVRGQAFRIAELESELRRVTETNAREDKKPRTSRKAGAKVT